MMDEKSKKLSKIIAVLLMIGLIGLFFLLYDKVFKIPNPLGNEEIKQPQNDEKLGIKDDLIQSLYARVMGKTYNNNFSFDKELLANDSMFQTKKVTINDISNQAKLQMVLWYLVDVSKSGTAEVPCAIKNSYEKRFAEYYQKEENFICGSRLLADPTLTEEEKASIDSEVLYYLHSPNKVEKVGRFLVSRVNIEKNIKYLFGSDVQFTYEDIETSSYICDLESDYICLKTFKEKENNPISNTEIIKATNHATYMEIESYYVYYDKEKGYLCQDTFCNSVIDENFNEAACDLKGDCEVNINTCQAGERCHNFENLKDAYPNRIPVYVHTFQKTEIGDYYWVSSQLKE